MPNQHLTSSVPATVTPHQHLDDDDLVAWLDQLRRAGHTVGYLHAQSLCKVFDTTSPSAQLHPADPDKKSKAMLKKLAQENLLLQHDLPLATLTAANAVDPAWPLVPAVPDEIVDLVDERLRALGRTGRGADISQPTAWKVWTDAGGCCMFEGCGANLSTIPLYTRSAKISYLAHIIASDPNGPRGTLADSHRLSDDADNIMLMCDAHHRLIDSFAPGEYPPLLSSYVPLWFAARGDEVKLPPSAELESQRYPAIDITVFYQASHMELVDYHWIPSWQDVRQNSPQAGQLALD